MERFARERPLPDPGAVKTSPCCQTISPNTTCKTLGWVLAVHQQMAMSQPGPAGVSLEVLGNAKQLEVILSSKMSGISCNVKESPEACLE